MRPRVARPATSAEQVLRAPVRQRPSALGMRLSNAIVSRTRAPSAIFQAEGFLLLKAHPPPMRPRVSKPPSRRSPGAECPMAVQVHGCFRRAPRESPPHEGHSCCALRIWGESALRGRKGAISATGLCRPATQRTMCVSVSDTPGEQYLTTLPYESGTVGSSGLWGAGQVIVPYETPLQSRKVIPALYLPSESSGPADDQWCWDRLGFAAPITKTGPEANLLVDITSNGSATDVATVPLYDLPRMHYRFLRLLLPESASAR